VPAAVTLRLSLGGARCDLGNGYPARSRAKMLAQRGISSEPAGSVSQEGAMDTPANGGVGAQPLQDVVVSTRYIYTLALALVGLALATSTILFLLID